MASKQEIIERINMPSLVMELVPSCRQVWRELSGLCPFHDDHNPSLSVNSSSGYFKCHACGEKGSIFDLYGKVHGLDFPASIMAMTVRAGLKLGKDSIASESVKPIEVDRHDYHDASGKLIYQRVRLEPGDNGRTKKYLFLDPATGEWKRPCEPLLYNLPEVLNASTEVSCQQ